LPAVMEPKTLREGERVRILSRLAETSSTSPPARVPRVWIEGSPHPVPRRGDNIDARLTGELLAEIDFLRRFIDVQPENPHRGTSSPSSRVGTVSFVVIPRIPPVKHNGIRGASLAAAADEGRRRTERFEESTNHLIGRLRERFGPVHLSTTGTAPLIIGAELEKNAPIEVRPLARLKVLLVDGPSEMQSIFESGEVDGFIRAAELTFSVPDVAPPKPAPKEPDLWHLTQLSAIGGNGEASADVEQPWIGIADTGIGEILVNKHNGEFAGRKVLFAEFDSDGNEVPGATYQDVHSGSHGSSIAVLAAGNTYGIAKNANLAVALCLDHNIEAKTNQVLGALQWLTDTLVEKGGNAVKVINCSFGVNSPGKPARIFESIIKTIQAEDIHVVSSIGNTGPGTTTSPGNFEGVIGVGAVDRNKAHANWSNHGYVVDRAGVKYFKPDFVTYGVDVPTLDRNHQPVLRTGTSFASPIVAGLVSRVASPGASSAVVPVVIGALQSLGVKQTIGKKPHAGPCYRL
jgi:hypothetical protein